MSGKLVEHRIPLSEPDLSGNELAYLRECVESNWVSSAGPFVNKFEQSFSALHDGAAAVAMVSGTAALHIALLVAGIRPGQEVLVSTLSFIAPANAIRYVGAHPVFVDADEATWQMDIGLVEKFLRDGCELRAGGLVNKSSGREVAALLPVHILGHPVDMAAISKLGREFGLKIVEDATESLGATCAGTRVGMIGDVGSFSFNGNKLLTTGGGGMVLTSNPEMADMARYLSSQAKDDPIESRHGQIGYNYRMTNIAAALGEAQLEGFEGRLKKKKKIAERYQTAFDEIDGVSFMPSADWAGHAYWLSSVRVEKRGRAEREALRGYFAEAGVEVRPLWQPLHLSAAHCGAETLGGELAEGLQDEILCLPSSVTLSDENQDRVVSLMSGFFA